MLEGVSYLLLLGIAMPIKYLSGYPDLGKQVVFWVGLGHGILFIGYATVTFVAWGKGALTAKLVGLAALASLLPFGPFVLDRKLKAIESGGSEVTKEVSQT